MKRIKHRRRRLRINNPLGFSLFCIACLAVGILLYLGIAWLVHNGPQLVAAFQTVVADDQPTPTAEPVVTPTVIPTANMSNYPADTPSMGTPSLETATPAIDSTATPALDENGSPIPTSTPTPDPNLPLYGYTICVDPCRDRNTKYSAECAYNLEMGQYLGEYLESMGATVVLTRTDNSSSVSNDDRAKTASSANSDIVIRLMCNEIDSSSHGCYIKTPSKYEDYAKALISAYSTATGIGIQAGKGNGVETAKDTMISGSDCPGVLLIMGNWNNKSDRAKLQDDAVKLAMAECIYNVLKAQLGA